MTKAGQGARRKQRYEAIALHSTYTLAFNLPPKMYAVEGPRGEIVMTCDSAKEARKFAASLNSKKTLKQFLRGGRHD